MDFNPCTVAEKFDILDTPAKKYISKIKNADIETNIIVYIVLLNYIFIKQV